MHAVYQRQRSDVIQFINILIGWFITTIINPVNDV